MNLNRRTLGTGQEAVGLRAPGTGFFVRLATDRPLALLSSTLGTGMEAVGMRAVGSGFFHRGNLVTVPPTPTGFPPWYAINIISRIANGGAR